MELQFDHIVHFIEGHPKKAIKEWQKQGIQGAMGGSHEKWGTYNSLLYARTSYIEFLAMENKVNAETCDNPLISQLVSDLHNGEGIGQICFRTTNIEKLKKELEEKGCSTLPIFPGSRKRQDGSIIHWKMLFIKGESTLPFPFFIEWGQSDEVRFKELKEMDMIDGKLEKHQIKSILFACRNAEQSASEWSRLFDFPIKSIGLDSVSSLKKATVLSGNTEIIFCEPLNEEGMIYHTLQSRGERPFSIQFGPQLFHGTFSLYGSFYQ
ncbi:VOC family protein [Cytobacillus depressus]|uniref:VOC family protein n=1 Tax=Cytobacillus depressus TaxID=1602942 RepID=A0A6L3V1U1_9BACI|nr:VOC family protein [Cytobacillus depressus]KAB2330236.1 VOC family protein [Cytobacillus depressus]